MAENIFLKDGWFTPNTYDVNFKFPTTNSGVYIIVSAIPNIKRKKMEYTILYIGSAKNIKSRHDGHAVLRILKETYQFVQFYFKEDVNYRQLEKTLIKQLQPKFNKQWR